MNTMISFGNTRTENREQRTENREQRTENREQRTEGGRKHYKHLTLLSASLVPLLLALTFFAGDCNSPTPIPSVPSGLTATVISSSQINLSWTAVATATKYNLFDGTTQIGGDITTTSYQHTGLTANSAHSYTLKACNSGGCSAASAAVNATTHTSITATELSKVKDGVTGVRDRYGVFTLSASGTVSNYRLAVKKASDPAPTATEMESGHHIKRNLSTTPIHVLITHYLNAKILDWYKAGLVAADLPTGMTKTVSVLNLVKDFEATGDKQWIAQSLLATSTEHTLYGMMEGGSEVKALLTFTTDATPSNNTAWSYTDPNLGSTSITVSSTDAYFLFPMQVRFDQTANLPVTFKTYLDAEPTAAIIDISSVDILGTPARIYTNLTYLITNSSNPSTDADKAVMFKGGCFVLIPTNKITDKKLKFGATIGISWVTSPAVLYLNFVQQ